MKNAIMQVTYFLNGPMFNLLFYCNIIERKWLLMRNLAIILPSNHNLSRKFYRFNIIDESIEILQKFQLKWKIVKHFVRLKQWAALRKLLNLPQPPIPPDKILLHLWNKKRDIQKYTDICIKYFLGVRKWCSANTFPDTKQKHACWKICKLRRRFGCILGACYFQFQKSWDS